VLEFQVVNFRAHSVEKKKGSKHLSFEGYQLDEWLTGVGKIALKSYSSNIVLISDCELTHDYAVYWSNFKKKVATLYAKDAKLQAVKLWHTSHLDLYYGAKKFTQGMLGTVKLFIFDENFNFLYFFLSRDIFFFLNFCH
jgi:hypothetical protein